ncbi:hypothetical protein TNCV_2260071 [Trichonephila clavipes]|nr:hypothetical protein TNCV_2260071 [Trichonephila clavipes]
MPRMAGSWMDGMGGLPGLNVSRSVVLWDQYQPFCVKTRRPCAEDRSSFGTKEKMPQLVANLKHRRISATTVQNRAGLKKIRCVRSLNGRGVRTCFWTQQQWGASESGVVHVY